MSEGKEKKRKHAILGSPKWTLLLSFVLVSAAVFFLVFAFKKSITVINFNEQTAHDYKVHTVKNEYYDEVLEKDKQYVTSIIDHIDINPNYTLKTDRKLDFTYTYKATGKIIVYDQSNNKNELFVKEYEILPEKTVENPGSDEVSISENLPIAYNDYNNYAKNYKENFKITGEDNLIVAFDVDVEGKLEGEENSVKQHYTTDFTIPLTENTMNITVNSNDKNEDGQFKIENEKIKKVPFFCGITLGVVGLILIFSAILTVVENNKNLSKYEKWLKKLKNEHGNYIVNTENKVSEENYEIVHVSSFSDLLDKAKLINKNILCKEDKDEEVTEFSVIEDSIIYKKVYSKQNEMFI